MKLFTPQQASHWYYPDGSACHEVPMKSKPGEMRDTTLADARKMGLLPSVTNIIGLLDRPELNAWRESQAVLSALTLPKLEDESIDDYAQRVVHDAKNQVSVAAVRGQKIHKCIEDYLCFRTFRPDMSVDALMQPFPEWADKNILEVIEAEQTVVGRGYAGRMDLNCALKEIGPAIIDFKSRKRYKGKFATYTQDDLQLAAYQAGTSPLMGDSRPTRVSVFIDSQEPSEPEIHIWPREKDVDAFAAFESVFNTWRYIKNYWPANL